MLDIAGGRGFISFELYTKNNVKTTLIEPVSLYKNNYFEKIKKF